MISVPLPLHPVQVAVEIDIGGRHPGDHHGIVARMRSGEAQRSQPIVLQWFLGAFEHGGLVAVHIAGHEFIDLCLVGTADHIVVWFPLGIVADHLVGLIPAPAPEEGIPRGILHHQLHERTSRRITTGELMARQVGQLNIHESRIRRTFHHGVLQQKGLVLQQSYGPCDGAIEMGFVRREVQGGTVVLQQRQHEGVAPHEVVSAVRGT